MRKWLLNMFFGKEIIELKEAHANLHKTVELAKKEKEFLLRNNTVFLDKIDINSSAFKTEIAAIWNNNNFRVLLHLIRNEVVAAIIKGGEAQGSCGQGMLKGIDEISIQMQKIGMSTNEKV